MLLIFWYSQESRQLTEIDLSTIEGTSKIYDQFHNDESEISEN